MFDTSFLAIWAISSVCRILLLCEEVHEWMGDETLPVTFLAELGRALNAREGVDPELASLLSQHLLTATPEEDCVGQTLRAITNLAAKRVAPKEESDE
jgi:hypothetical protein